MRRATAGLAAGALAFALAGCLAPADDEPSMGPSRAPAGERPESVPGCPNYVTVVETGPLPTDFSEDGPLARAQARLEADIMAFVRYTQEHPDEFGSIRFENAPRVRIVVAFTGHLAEHCAALRELAEFPDEFELVWSAHSEADLRALADEIVAVSRDGFLSASVRDDRVELSLRADREVLAGELLAKYGDVVRITVGLFSYPDRTPPEGASCGAYGKPAVADSPLWVTPLVGAHDVRSGSDFSGMVTVINSSDAPVDFDSGRPAEALVVRPGTAEPVGVFYGLVAGSGIGKMLAPGESIEIDVVGGTAACDPSLGYALPPGEYEVVVPIQQYAYPDPNAEVVVTYLLSEPAPLTVVP